MKIRTITSFLLISILVLANVIGGFAAIQFSDVGSNHWAYDFISDVAEKEIVNGYFDDSTLSLTFKPDKSVTYVEAIQFIYSTLKSADIVEKDSSLALRYKTVLNNNAIPSWAHDAMAYALDNNIVLPEELSVFIKNGVQTKAEKEDIAVYLGKALDLNKQIDPRPAIVPTLMFNDAEMITRGAKPFVVWLVNKGILAGDDQNKFNPSKIITRAEMATMCSKAYDLLEKVERVQPPTQPTIPTTPTNPTTPSPSDGTTLERIIDYVALNADTIIVRDSQNNTDIYKLDKNIIILEGTRIKRLRDLDEGDNVRLYFDRDGEINKVEITDEDERKFKGYIDSISDENTYYLITLQDSIDVLIRKSFKVYDSTIIERGRDEVSIRSLRKGDKVEVEYIGDAATKIEAESEDAEYTGILESEVFFGREPIIEIRVNDNRILELPLEDDPYIRRDGRRADFVELKAGDIVTVYVENGYVEEISATSRNVDKEDEGVIKTLTIGNPSQLTIASEDDGIERTYDISDTVYIEIDDDDDVHLYDLRPNYYVELEIEDNEVTEIDAEKVRVNNVITGEILKVYDDYNVLIVKYIDSKTQKYENITITTTKDTKIIADDGETIRLSLLGSGYEVFIDGYTDDELYIANKIILLED